MARTDTLGNFLTDVANAIRTKKGTTDTIPANTFDTEISSIEGGSSKYTPRYISFYNYRGTELNEELANLDTSLLTDTHNMFYDCLDLTSLDLSTFDTSNVTTMSNMFRQCAALTTLNMSNFNTSNVTDMGFMFNACLKLTSLDVSNFDASKLTTICAMFSGCSGLTNLNLGDFNTTNVTDMSQTFSYDRNLVSIPKLNAIKVNNISYFATQCTSLTDFGGLENLGGAYNTSTRANNFNYKLDLSDCTALTEQSLINLLTNLYDIATKGCNIQQVVLGSTNLAKLTSEEGQTALSNATAKGWSIS